MLSVCRSRAIAAFLGASILALAACSEQVPVAPRTDASRVQGSQSTLASVGSNRRLVALRDGRPAAAVVARIRALGGTVARTHEGAGLVIASGLTDAAVASLAQQADVSDVLRDRMVQWVPVKALKRGYLTASAATIAARKGKFAPDDQSGAAFFAEFQWNMRVTRASDVWKLNDGHGAGTTVCDLDTGVDPTHLDLNGKVDLGVSTSMVVTEPDIIDRNGHGTFVSSQIAGNGIGMASVAPQATLCQVKVLDQTGSGLLSDAIAGVIYAADAKADVINMSFGAYFTLEDPEFKQITQDFQRAVNYAHRKGVTLVASAGNGDSLGNGIDLATDQRSLFQLPAELDNVISVGATAPHAQAVGTFDDLATYSNYGFPGVDVFAPGGDFTEGSVIEDLILGACSSYSDPACADGNSYSIGAGTSFAAPIVAGEAAVIESDKRGNKKPLDNCIIQSSDKLTSHVPDRVFGFGRVDVLGGIHCKRIV
jgi:lantibiotic leader peptide-processing serine protease